MKDLVREGKRGREQLDEHTSNRGRGVAADRRSVERKRAFVFSKLVDASHNRMTPLRVDEFLSAAHETKML